MNYEPKKIGKRPEKISLILFALSMVCVLLANAVVDTMQWILQVITIVLLGIFIYILVKWSFTDYKYEIKAKSKLEICPFEDIPAERLQLFVHKKQSRRGYAADFVCTVGDIEMIEPVEKEAPKKGKRYFYCRNMSGGTRYALTVRDEPAPLILVLEINDDGKDFLEFLRSKTVCAHSAP